MREKIVLLVIAVASVTMLSAQTRKYDSTMKVGKVGYRVYSNNKNEDKNMATIAPVGFNTNSREATIEIRGRITKSEVDDLNRDGFPDLVIYIFNGVKNIGTVIGVSSEKNEGIAPIYFPDIVDDPKLRVGYNGQDQFSLMEGMLLRRFPLYSTGDSANIKPIGIMRQVMYSVVPDEKGMQKFKVSRTYEFAKP